LGEQRNGLKKELERRKETSGKWRDLRWGGGLGERKGGGTPDCGVTKVRYVFRRRKKMKRRTEKKKNRIGPPVWGGGEFWKKGAGKERKADWKEEQGWEKKQAQHESRQSPKRRGDVRGGGSILE